MKKTSFILAAILIISSSCKSTPTANPDEVSLNTAIQQAASLMETRLARGTKIALINFTSPSQSFSEYVLDELSSVLVNNRLLTVVDRASLDKVRQELNFNLSGEVSDESAQAIGKMLGAQAIVTGSLTSMGDLRRVMFKAIITETTTVAVQYNADIINDQRVKALLAQGGGSQSLTYGGQSRTTTAGRNGNTTAQQAPAAPQNGTYTFYPRLQPYKGASPEAGVYIHKIVVRGDFMSIYLCNSPTGATNNYPGGTYWMFSNEMPQHIILQDLENPARSYNPEWGRNGAVNWDNDGCWYVFKGVKAARFSLTSTFDTLPSVFEEIILEMPD